jgi:hypothetical protein
MAKKVLTDLTIRFLSAVDMPAQEHATARTTKRDDKGDPAMSQKTAEQLQAEIDELQKRLSRSESLAGMTDAEKAFQRTLDPEDRPAFVAKSAADRKATMEAAEKADPVYFTAKDGTVFRQSQKMIADYAKRAEAAEAASEETAKRAAKDRISKRVEGWSNLNNEGERLTKLATVIDGMAEADREPLFKQLDALNKAAKQRHGTEGVQGTHTSADISTGDIEKAQKAFDEYVEAHAAKIGKSATEAQFDLLSKKKDKKALQLQKALKNAQRGESDED